MFKRTLLFAIGVAAGATIGAYVAYLVGVQFWWIGLLSGGFLSYLFVDIKEIPHAWRAARNHLKIPPMRTDERWRRVLLGTATGLSVITFFPGVLLFFHFLVDTNPYLNQSCIGLAISVFLLCFLPALYMKNPKKDYLFMGQSKKKPIKWWLGLLVNGLTIPLFLLSCLLYGVFVVLFWKTLLPALWIFFKYIHSKKRVLAFIDGSLAILLAYLIAGPTIEMLAIAFVGGLVISPIHFYFVSIKLLNLVPNGNVA